LRIENGKWTINEENCKAIFHHNFKLSTFNFPLTMWHIDYIVHEFYNIE